MYAMELATRMLIAGIDVKRISQPVSLDVEAWKYMQPPYIDLANSGTSGWLNRHVEIYPKTHAFSKDAFVVFIDQLASNLIPMYFEPDLPWNVASCIFLPYMSVALGGNSTQALSAQLVGVEMPAYRFGLRTNIAAAKAQIPTYDVNHYLPLVDRGAVTRFFSYKTQDEINAIITVTGKKNIRVYEYDFQVHARTDALIGGAFNITLPTNADTAGYLILKKDGTYATLTPTATKSFGQNVGTIVVAEHGNVPFTVNVDSAGRPVVGDGSNRTVAHALPVNDDLIGVRIVEISNWVENIFTSGIPAGAVEIPTGIEWVNPFDGSGTILSEAMLDGWTIIAVTPASGTNWAAVMNNGQVIVAFTGDVNDAIAKVTITKGGVTRTLDVKFSGHKKGSGGGCNAGFLALALLAVPFILRKR
jgi:Synergist-CTERM protein sorting domain-containing protein